jgi:nitrous oxide reductase accessory protein NosL
MYVKLLLVALTTLTFSACEKKDMSGVAKVHWDRDMCARCVMVVSDRHNTTQARNPKTGKKYMFDDIGCMALWFEEENITWRESAIVWITDVDTGEWIDAKKAYYDTQNITPMAYGFSAHKSKESIKEGQEIVDYDEVLRRVIKIGK